MNTAPIQCCQFPFNSIKLNHLIQGYIAREMLNQNNSDHPFDLNSIIVEFCGVVFVYGFDVFHESHKECIQRHGALIKRKQGLYGINRYSSKWVYFNVGSSFKMDHGQHSFSIKCIKPNSLDAVGITSDLNSICNEHHIWYGKGKGYSYTYKGGGAISGLSPMVRSIKQWKKNDVLTVKIDCEFWNIAFYKNGRLMGKAVHIQPNLAYHAFLGTTVNDTEYLVMNES